MASNRPLSALIVAAASVLLLAGCATGSTPPPGTAPGSTASGGGDTVTAGKLTIATGEPAYSPWVADDKPESGKGFEAAVAYAVADKLGYAKSDVVWVRKTFDESIAPGPKDFDMNLQQFSITDKRKTAVDFSSAYYTTTQVVITVAGSAAANATSLADLKPPLVGTATGTTSFTAIEKLISPDLGAQAFSTNDDAVLALKSGTVDAIVVDLPTAFYLTGAELDGGKIVGQIPTDPAAAGDQFGVVLPKSSRLTAKVTEAVDALRADGTLDQLATTWLADAGSAPVLKEFSGVTSELDNAPGSAPTSVDHAAPVSDVELGRRRYRRSQSRRSTVIALLSTVAFAAVVWFTVIRTPGFERVQQTFFSAEVAIAALPRVIEGL